MRLLVLLLFLTSIAHADPCAPASSGLSKCEFDGVVSKIERIYKPKFAALGGTLYVHANWSSNDENAHANEFGWIWLVSFTGGLARQPLMTRDAFALVACHEIGHHLGGAPRMLILPLSSEGEADYFATLKCAREFFADEDNAAALRGKQVDTYAFDQCKASFATSADRLICLRSAMASKALIHSLQRINKDSTVVSFRTPDTTTPGWISWHDHPLAQCRLDTLFNGARCGASVATPLSTKSYVQGSCDREGEAPNAGSRPRCWFTP